MQKVQTSASVFLPRFFAAWAVLLAVIGLLVVLPGCASSVRSPELSADSPLADGYQFGDLTREAVKLQADFCIKGDPIARFLLLRLLDSTKFQIEGQGLCEIDIIATLAGIEAESLTDADDGGS